MPYKRHYCQTGFSFIIIIFLLSFTEEVSLSQILVEPPEGFPNLVQSEDSTSTTSVVTSACRYEATSRLLSNNSNDNCGRRQLLEAGNSKTFRGRVI